MRIHINSKCQAAQHSLIKGQKGMAVVLVLVFCTALMVLGSALITYAVNEKLITAYNSSNIRLYYISEAGIEAAVTVLIEDTTFNGLLSGDLNGGSYLAEINSLGQSEIMVISRASLDKYEKYLTVILEIDEDERLIIKKWGKASAIKPAGHF